MKKLKATDKIETERLIIEMPKMEDAKDIYSLIDYNVTEFFWWEKPSDYKYYEDHINRKIISCNEWKSWEALVRLKTNNKVIWRFWIIKYTDDINSIEIAYWLWKKFWWKWYIPECVEKIKDFWFSQLWVNRILIIATKENIKSIRVIEKCWFKLDWIIRWEALIKWKIVDKAIYTFLKDDFK